MKLPRSSFAWFCLVVFTAGSPIVLAADSRPNVLFILAEDIGPQLACYGEPLVKTPNLDALAARGVRFTRAFTTAPVCSAKRFSACAAFIAGMSRS